MSKNEVRIREASDLELAGWDELVSRFENNRVTHTVGWIRSLEELGKGRALFLVYEKDGEIVGCLPGLLTRFGPLRIFGSPLPGWQTVSLGPVFDETKITCRELMSLLISFLESGFGVHHIEIMSHTLDEKAMTENGFCGEMQPTYRVQMFPENEAQTLKAMKDSARRNIKRGNKLGLITEFREDEDFIDEVYSQINEVFVRGGNVVPFGKERVSAFFRKMKAAGALLAVAVYLPEDKKCVATGLFTVANRELLLWMWAHRTEYRWYRPTELMTWKVMQKAMLMGSCSFDLMGRGDFKSNFGATLDTSKIRWIRSRYRWLVIARSMADKCYRWQQSVRGRFARLGNRKPTRPPF